MFGHEFYHQTMRRYVVIFGTLFNEVIISRALNDGTQQKRFKVPISYGPQQKFLAMLDQNSSLSQPSAITLPRMSFQMENIAYDPDRRLTSLSRNTRTLSANDNSLSRQYTPAPYNLDFTLSIMAKYSEDGTKILEQILPFFKPEWTTSVKLVDDLDLYFDIPTILTGVTSEEVYEGSFQERQVVLWNLTFTMKGYFFGPVATKKIIKFANTNFYNALSSGSWSNTVLDSVNVYPGLLANGSPADFVSSQVSTSLATANLTSYAVNAITVTSPGLGYNSATVTIAAPATSTATATADLGGKEFVESITITDGGWGYATAPTVTFSDPETGSDVATGTATISNYEVTGITITNAGSGYSSAPTITIADPPAGTTATATANVIGYGVNSITVTEAGGPYETAPTVTVSAPDNNSVTYTSVNFDDDWDYVVVIEEGS